MGQRDGRPTDAEVSAGELVSLVCCDLGAIVRGRSLLSGELDGKLGVGWVPANLALTPLGPVAEPNPFGSTGDLRLLPDIDTRVRLDGGGQERPLELLLCDIVETDGRPWECCPRRFLRETLGQLRSALDIHVVASFEHEFQLVGWPTRGGAGGADRSPPALPFSGRALRHRRDECARGGRRGA